jgi:uncharacterized protein (TIGR02246 family)
MSPQAQGTPQEEHAIRAATTEFVNAWNRNDIKALAACFASDGNVINPAGRAARGRGEVEKLLNDEQNTLFKGSHISMTQTHVHFLKPDVAIVDYDFEVTRVRAAEGKQTTLKGLQSVVLRKDADKWLVVAARPMIPTPMPGAHN